MRSPVARAPIRETPAVVTSRLSAVSARQSARSSNGVRSSIRSSKSSRGQRASGIMHRLSVGDGGDVSGQAPLQQRSGRHFRRWAETVGRRDPFEGPNFVFNHSGIKVQQDHNTRSLGLSDLSADPAIGMAPAIP